MSLKILIIDDDQGLRLGIKSHLKETGAEIHEAFDGVNGIEVFQALKPETVDFVLLDVDMPRKNGLEVLKVIKTLSPGTTVIMMTAYATIENAVFAVKNGAFSYLSKPINYQDLKEVMEKAADAHDLVQMAAHAAPIFYDSDQKIVGKNEKMQSVFAVISRLSKVDTPVLIRGESGTGKELVAKAIHFNSPRRDGKFVAVNCSAIPENLFESEFFGHEKGAFTGADQRKIGKFQFAESGTLFLDELGDLPLHMQVKLLRVLQEKLFTPVGANQDIETDVRIIAATNRDLEKMITQNEFRDDLYYRLNVMPIVLPPLKERREDIERLIHLFVKKFNKTHSKQVRKISPEALMCLRDYDWPGNIRELENVIEHTFILNDGHDILLSHLPEKLLKAVNISLPSQSKTDGVQSLSASEVKSEGDIASKPVSLFEEKKIEIPLETFDFQKQKEEFERRFIIEALKANGGKINQTALQANIPKKTLLRKIEKYGIDPKAFAP